MPSQGRRKRRAVHNQYVRRSEIPWTNTNGRSSSSAASVKLGANLVVIGLWWCAGRSGGDKNAIREFIHMPGPRLSQLSACISLCYSTSLASNLLLLCECFFFHCWLDVRFLCWQVNQEMKTGGQIEINWSLRNEN